MGGHPAWIQDAEYPACPLCDRTMMAVITIALEDFLQADGIFYVHHCAKCAVAGVSYQQS